MSIGVMNSNVGNPGWTGHCTNVVDVSTLDDLAEGHLYDPPLRMLVATVAGNAVVTLLGDDTAVGASKVTIALGAGYASAETRLAIRKIWATGTTATGLQAFR